METLEEHGAGFTKQELPSSHRDLQHGGQHQADYEEEDDERLAACLRESIASECLEPEVTANQLEHEQLDMHHVACEAKHEAEAEPDMAQVTADDDSNMEDDWWGLVCSGATRLYTAQMQLTTNLLWLRVAVATAMKCLPSSIDLRLEGNVVPDCNLGDLEPPYMFEIGRPATIPTTRKRSRGESQQIHVDLGRIHSISEESQAEGHQGASSSSGAVSSLSAGAEGEPSPEMIQHEHSMMEANDADVKQIVIQRPRDRITCTYREPFNVADLMRHFAVAKRVKRQGFMVYEKLSEESSIRPDGEYFLNWKQARGGAGTVCTISTTLTFASESESLNSGSNEVAREHLDRLADLIHRVIQVNQSLAAWGRTPSPHNVTVISLALASESLSVYGPITTSARGGMYRASNSKSKKKEPIKWGEHHGAAGPTAAILPTCRCGKCHRSSGA